MPLLRLFDASGNRTISVYQPNQSTALFVQHSGNYYKTSGTLPLNTWGHLAISVAGAGSGAGTVSVLLNGTVIYQTSTASLASPIASIQIGNEVKGQAFTIFADTIAAQ